MQNSRLRRALDREAELRASGPATGPGTTARAVRSAVARLAHVDPLGPRTPWTVVEKDVARAGDVTCERYVFGSDTRDGVRAVLLIPADRTGPGPAVLVSPGQRAVLQQVTGLESPDFPDRAVAARLSRAGFVTLTVDYGLSERSTGDRCAPLAAAFLLGSQPLLGALVEDALTALDWLATHPSVDPRRIGLFGHSLGGAVALHTALLATARHPLCVASHFGTYPVIYGDLMTGNPAAVLPGILRHADLPELFGALEPRPLHIQFGTRDANLSPDDTSRAAARLRSVWPADGGIEPAIHALAAGHGTDCDLASDFFRRHLADSGGTQPGEPPVPPLRIRFDVAQRRAAADLVDLALSSGTLTLGPLLAAFEDRARTWIGADVAAVSSGSAALEIVLRTIGVAGRTVLVPVNTFFATAAAAERAGAHVTFVDMELTGLGMDPDALERALDTHPDTAVVVVVHVGGVVSPALREIQKLCAAREVALVEDAAHAFGSRLDGARAGTFGRFGAFSFYPTKVLTTGEGGLVSVRSAEDLAAVRSWRDHGRTCAGSTLHDRAGGNWRLSDPNAAIGLAHLDRLAAAIRERLDQMAWYDARLPDVPALTPYRVPPGVEVNGYKYIAFLPEGTDRAALKARLRTRHGVSLAGEVYDRPLHRQPHFLDRSAPGDFPHAGWFAERHICLPVFPSMTRSQQERVMDALRAELT